MKRKFPGLELPKVVVEKVETVMLFGREHSLTPCPSCLQLLAKNVDERDQMWASMVLPVPLRAPPMTRRRDLPFKNICFDCAAAEGLMALMGKALNFYMARVVTGNDRLERLRLPGVHIGASPGPVSQEGDLHRLLEWQEREGFSDGLRDEVRRDALLERGES